VRIDPQRRIFYSYLPLNDARNADAALTSFSVERTCLDCAAFAPAYCYQDCADTWRGKATVDECGVCAEVSTLDCEGICGGPFSRSNTGDGRCECAGVDRCYNWTLSHAQQDADERAKHYVFRVFNATATTADGDGGGDDSNGGIDAVPARVRVADNDVAFPFLRFKTAEVAAQLWQHTTELDSSMVGFPANLQYEVRLMLLSLHHFGVFLDIASYLLCSIIM
jgi:hypothetical protein